MPTTGWVVELQAADLRRILGRAIDPRSGHFRATYLTGGKHPTVIDTNVVLTKPEHAKLIDATREFNQRYEFPGWQSNPEVARKPHASIVSEANALRMMRQLAQDIIDGGTVKESKDNAASIVGYCDVLLGQVKSGIHANPTLATFMAGNPMVTMSHHVQAIMYRHAKDNDFYIHTFGGRDVPIREIGGRQIVRLDELPARTGVDMRSDKRILVLQRPDGKPIADDF